MKEKILEALANLGFKLDALENLGYVFDYEDIHFYYRCSDDDESFLNIGIIGIYDYDGDKVSQYCAVSEKINATMKYVKAYTFIDGLGLFYERELFGDENLETVLQYMIFHLEASLIFARKTIAEIEAAFAEGAEHSDSEASDIDND